MERIGKDEYYVASSPPQTPEEWFDAAQAIVLVACSEVEHLQVPMDAAIQNAADLLGYAALVEQLRSLPPQVVEGLKRRSARSAMGITGTEPPEEVARLHNTGRLTFKPLAF